MPCKFNGTFTLHGPYTGNKQMTSAPQEIKEVEFDCTISNCPYKFPEGWKCTRTKNHKMPHVAMFFKEDVASWRYND